MVNKVDSTEQSSSPPTKIAKMEETAAAEDPAPAFLRRAKVKEILGNDLSHKTASLLLEDDEGAQGVLMLIKTAFSENADILGQLAEQGELKLIAKNDIFGSYELTVPAELNGLQTQLIYPANEKIIAKYRFEEKFIVRETAEDYKTITLPYIEQSQMSLQWVYNILEQKAEQDKVIFQDPDLQNGFVLANDFKWDGKNLDTLYVLAIINRHGVKSIRDLTADDLPMLENIREKCLNVIHEKYGLRPDQMRVYFHYQPSFYHLHVHFVNLKYDAPASSTLYAILLDDVINNLRLMPEYYAKTCLSFTRKKTDRLLDLFRKAGRCNL